MLRNIISKCLPAPCVLCERLTHRSIALCAACEEALPWIDQTQRCFQCGLLLPHSVINVVQDRRCGACLKQAPPFDALVAACAYRDSLREFVSHLKFSRQHIYAPIFAEIMLKAITPMLANTERRPERLIPVPLHKHRLAKRGFNQSQEIAESLSKQLNIPIDTRSCVRVKSTRSQSGLRKSERKVNTFGAFLLKCRPLGNNIAIIDDVVTTGSTAAALAATLKRAGVKRVDVWCVARTDVD